MGGNHKAAIDRDDMTEAMQAGLAVAGSALICGGALYLWALARGSFQARAIIVLLWLVLLAMSIVAGVPWVIIMGSATVLMGLWIYVHIAPWWWW